MNLVFITEARFIKNSSGVYGDVAFSKDLWTRYLDVFDEIFVVARVKYNGQSVEEGKVLSSREKVHFIELPYYIGLKSFLKVAKQVKLILKRTVSQHLSDRFICRVPGVLGRITINELNKVNKKYALEVVGDPWDVFAPGAVKTAFRPIIRIKSYIELRKIVADASAVLYVTEKTLQQRYPANQAGFTTNASNVMIEDENSVATPKIWERKETYSIISIGSLAQLYKAPDILIKAVADLHKKGLYCSLVWLGDGVNRVDMTQLVTALGLDDYVFFKGNVNKEQVKDYLQKSDLFVLASRTEGLPRAMIEAMSLGLPCVGTNVGGIPELLTKEVIVKKNSTSELSDKIEELLLNEEFYNSQAERNYFEAKKYFNSVLSERRTQFYKYIKEKL